MDNKIIDKLLYEKMNFTPEQIDTIVFICKEVYKDMESDKKNRNENLNFSSSEPILEILKEIKKNNEKVDAKHCSSTIKSNAFDPSLAFYRKTSFMRNIMAIVEYINIIFENGCCIKTDTKSLSIYKNKVNKLISENTDVSIDLDSIFKRWEIQLLKHKESYKSSIGFYSIRCEIRLSLNNDISISRFFDYRRPTSQRLIFALLLYMKLRFKSKGWNLNNVFFEDISDKSKLSSFNVGKVSLPCIGFKFEYTKNEQESKSAVKSKGGKK